MENKIVLFGKSALTLIAIVVFLSLSLRLNLLSAGGGEAGPLSPALSYYETISRVSADLVPSEDRDRIQEFAKLLIVIRTVDTQNSELVGEVSVELPRRVRDDLISNLGPEYCAAPIGTDDSLTIVPSSSPSLQIPASDLLCSKPGGIAPAREIRLPAYGFSSNFPHDRYRSESYFDVYVPGRASVVPAVINLSAGPSLGDFVMKARLWDPDLKFARLDLVVFRSLRSKAVTWAIAAIPGVVLLVGWAVARSQPANSAVPSLEAGVGVLAVLSLRQFVVPEAVSSFTVVDHVLLLCVIGFVALVVAGQSNVLGVSRGGSDLQGEGTRRPRRWRFSGRD